MSMRQIPTSVMKFDQLTAELKGQRWSVAERETALTVGPHGETTRYARKCIVVDGVAFVADNSVSTGGEQERLHETTVNAFLAVEAARALPSISAELAAARTLLNQVVSQLSGTDLTQVQKFLDEDGHAANFDSGVNAF